MGNHIEDCIYSGYIIDYDEIKKVVPEEVERFEEKATDMLVLLNLSYNERFTMNDILEHCAVDDLEGSRIYKTLSDGDYHELEDKLQEIYGLMCYKPESILERFKQKTEIEVNIEYNYKEEKTLFMLRREHTAQLTPQAQQLKNMGVDFNFEIWVED